MNYEWELQPQRTGDSWASRYRLVVRQGSKEIGATYLNARWRAKWAALRIIAKYERSLKRGTATGRIEI